MYYKSKENKSFDPLFLLFWFVALCKDNNLREVKMVPLRLEDLKIKKKNISVRKMVQIRMENVFLPKSLSEESDFVEVFVIEKYDSKAEIYVSDEDLIEEDS